MTPVIVVDTETTGYWGCAWTATVEVGAVLLDEEGREASAYTSLVRPPTRDIRAEAALAVNHLTWRDLARAPPAQDVCLALLAWAPTGVDWTAYNVPFDRKSIHQGLRVLEELVVWGPCILAQARKALPKPHTLSAVAHALQVVPDGPAHRALTDARTAARVLTGLRRRQL